MQQILIVDGNSILNRAFYGVRPLTTHDGLQTGAVYGMMTILLRHLEQLKPDYAVCAFDLKAPTFRHLRYDGYKANRHGMPDELAVQLPYAKEAMAALGFAVCTCEGYEADDILGTLSRRANERGICAKILTGDRDSLQLITDKTAVLLAGNKETTLYDEAQFTSVYGISPTQFVDVKAIMGDSSDNIPGVRGIGEKGALSLISAFGTLDGVYENLDSPLVKPAMRQKLETDRENAYLSQFLARIDCDAPLAEPFDSFAYPGLRGELLVPLCNRLEFFTLRQRFEEKLAQQSEAAPNTPSSEEDAPAPVSVIELAEADTLTLPATRYALLEADDALWLCDGADVFCIDTDDLTALPLLARPDVSVCCVDAKPLYHRFLETNRPFPLGFDLSLAAYVLHARESGYDLSSMAQTWLGHDCGDTPAEQVVSVFSLWDALDTLLKETDCAPLYYDVELPLCRLLAEMERAGFAVDCQGLTDFSALLQAQMEDYTARIYEMAGHDFNVNSPKQLGAVLFEELGLPCKKKTKTGYSTNAEILEELRPYHPIVGAILDYRQVAKLQSTYAQGLLRAADEGGRVHTTFHQSKTLTGRLSSSEPNLQNIPIRTELGRQLRNYFVPRQGYLLVGADYSQIELRLLADIAQDQAMLDAFAGEVDIHTLTASQVFHVPMEKVSFEQRKQAKAVNFGIVYGISKFSLSEDLHISRAEAGSYIDRYFDTYPGVRAYMDNIVTEAKERGYVTTLWGRRRYIPELTSQKAPLRAFGERVARNSPIQGTAADLMKCAMIAVDRALKESGIDARIILQIHDELIVEAKADCAAQAAQILQREMEGIHRVRVPLVAQTSIGENLLDSKG